MAGYWVVDGFGVLRMDAKTLLDKGETIHAAYSEPSRHHNSLCAEMSKTWMTGLRLVTDSANKVDCKECLEWLHA